MKRITNLIFIGHLTISIPVLIIYLLFYFAFGISTFGLITSTIVSWSYWSYVVPKWKLSSIKKLNNASDFRMCESLAINSFLIWPENHFLSSTEFWYPNALYEFTALRKELN